MEVREPKAEPIETVEERGGRSNMGGRAIGIGDEM